MTLSGTPMRALALAGFVAGAAVVAPSPALAQTPPPPRAGAPAVPAQEVDADNDSPGYTPAEGVGAPSPLQISGYVDLGVAHAGGDGTSFAPGDQRLPADYVVDAFAPAVNSRGEAASTDSGGRFINGFVPRSAGIGGRTSAMINTVDFDFRYNVPAAPLMFFTRLQILPRFTGTEAETRPLLEQAFGRLVPFDSREFAISAGKFDSVFGIEYLDNQANIRTGITPSLIARYTTGQSLGAKAFYRIQIPAAWSAVSLNVSATTSGTFVEALQMPDVSLTGVPVGAARLGYELNLPAVQLKLGGSGLYGPRNDQRDSAVKQRIVGADVRLAVAGLYLSAEYIRVDEDEGGEKITSLGVFPIASAFHARGFYAQLAYALDAGVGPLHKLTAYARYEQRHAWFGGYTPITVDRITGGLRLDLWEALIIKGELLFNRELEGAPTVANNVEALSVVYTW